MLLKEELAVAEQVIENSSRSNILSLILKD